jgi:hypothetical protein
MDHVGQALNSKNYAAAQVYATLLVAEAQDSRTTIDVNLANWETLPSQSGATSIHRDPTGGGASADQIPSMRTSGRKVNAGHPGMSA